MAPDDLSPTEFARDLSQAGSSGTNHPGGVLVVMADGSTQFISQSTRREQLQAWSTIAGGEPTE
jgi:hypothetical protein